MTDQQLSVSLSLDISYVYGTVNGVEADFSLSSPGIWSAVVPRSEDGRYDVSITAYNSLGTPTTYNTVIYYLAGLITPKINWTAADFYNFYDLNRVEANTQYVSQALTAAGYNVTLEAIRVDRDMVSIEFSDSLNRVERNIGALKENFYEPTGWETPKTNWQAKQPFDWRDANRLERNLVLIFELISKTVNSLKYCGTFYCGEGGDIY